MNLWNSVIWRYEYYSKRAAKVCSNTWSYWRWHISEETLYKSLKSLVCDTMPQILMVHASLNRCGWIRGGKNQIFHTLKQFSQTLCMPTHTYCYPTTSEEAGPVFEVNSTPSVVGQLTDFFWRIDGVVRSLHPTHSLASVGAMADYICRGHELCDTPCGTGTPYEKLILNNAAVLMFGTTLKYYTLFYYSEHQAGIPFLYFPRPIKLRAKDKQGRIHSIIMKRQNVFITRRFFEMDKILEKEGLLKRCTLGRGELLFIPSSKQVHEFLVEKISHDPCYLITPEAKFSLQNVK